MLYSFGVEILLLFLQFASIFSKKIKVFLRTRKGILDTILQNIKVDDRVLWFHCASLGEFEQEKVGISWCKHFLFSKFSGNDMLVSYDLE